MAQLSQLGKSTADQLKDLPLEEQKTIVEGVLEANPGLIPNSDASKVQLWKTLLIGLFSVAFVALVGVIVLALNGVDVAALVVVATAIVTGTIGLFAKSPTSG